MGMKPVEVGLGGGEPLEPRPSKVVAVDLGYTSRATERGWVPEIPSYHLLPPSSLTAGSGEVLRPDGCRLLGFAGQVALVIGEPARSVRPEDGLAHVAAVTAANDLTVHDLDHADGGSHLRAKGGDGYTPIGPRLLDAHRVDLTALVVRTWRNGQLVQEAATAEELLFSFGLLVADLSRTITLEPGDLLLTGTPAGGGVAEPGDLLEVEVTAGFATTGRLATRVVAALAGSLHAYGAMPRQDPVARAAAVGAGATPRPSAPPMAPAPPAPAADAAPDPGTAPAHHSRGAAPEGRTIDPAVLARLAAVATATLAQQLRRRGLNGVVMVGLTATRPERKLVGRARTVRYLPAREDVLAERGGGTNAQRRAVEALEAGEVLVVEARGDQEAGTIGDLLVLRAERRGAAGIVTDGPLRDASAIRGIDLPVFHRGTSPAQLGRRHVPYETDVAVACAGVLVEPGDLLVGDADGVVVVPDHVAAEVSKAALEQERQERFVAERVAAGASIVGLYPLGPDQEAAYRAWLAARGEMPATP